MKMINPYTKHRYCLIILLVISGSMLYAQQPLTLDDAILKGLDNNFQIRITDQEYNIAKLNN